MRVVSLDIETSGMSWMDRVLTIGVAYRDESGSITSDSVNVGQRSLFDTPVTPPQAAAWLQGHLRGADWVTLHSSAFDLPYLARMQALDLANMTGKVFDTLVMARATGSHQSVGLNDLVVEYDLPRDKRWDSYKAKRARLEEMDPKEVGGYCQEDCKRGLLLFEQLYPMAEAIYGEPWLRNEADFSVLTSQMRVDGIGINTDMIHQLLEERKVRLGQINMQLYTRWRIEGPNSVKALVALLDRHRVPYPETVKGNPNLDEASFKSMLAGTLPDEVRECLELVMEGREISKEVSTWLQGFLDHVDNNGRIHPLLSVGGTVSYRYTCSQPQAQAVKKELQGMWDVDVEADYSQAELRLGAAYGAENAMAEAFANDVDIHLATAMEMYGKEEGQAHRKYGKTANFAGFYGGGGAAIAEALGIPLEMGQQIATKWRTAYRSVANTSKQAEQAWLSRGYVTLSHGKRLYASPDDLKRRPYKAFNQLIQGSVAEILKTAMLGITRKLPEVKLALQVHDDLKMYVLESHPRKREELAYEAVRIMQQSAPADILNRTDPPIEMKVDYTVRGR